MPLGLPRAREAAGLLKALGDPTRLSMVLCLWKAQAPVCSCALTARFPPGHPTVSQPMARVRAAGLVESKKRGIWIYYRSRDDLAPATVALLGTLLDAAEGT